VRNLFDFDLIYLDFAATLRALVTLRPRRDALDSAGVVFVVLAVFVVVVVVA